MEQKGIIVINCDIIKDEDLDTFCRCCLSKDQIFNIFELKYEGMVFSEIMINLLNTEVDINDEMPKNICEKCIAEIIRFYQFKTFFNVSKTVLKTLISRTKRQSTCDMIEVPFEDSGKSLDIFSTIKNEIWNDEMDNFKVKLECSDHISEKLFEEDYKTENTTDNSFVRQNNGQNMKKFRNIKNTEDPFKGLRRRRKNYKTKPRECNICFAVISSSANLRRHIKTHTGEKPHVCEICGKSFIQGPALVSHRRIHTGEKSHVCEICGRGFAQVSSLISHRRTHTGDRPYVCNSCSKSFSQVGQLKIHMLCHTGNKPFLCEICSESFRQQHHLKRHLRTHTGERPYACQYCDKTFTDNVNLKIHTTTHTGETPYACDMCSMKFCDSASLRKHKNQHLLENKDE